MKNINPELYKLLQGEQVLEEEETMNEEYVDDEDELEDIPKGFNPEDVPTFGGTVSSKPSWSAPKHYQGVTAASPGSYYSSHASNTSLSEQYVGIDPSYPKGTNPYAHPVTGIYNPYLDSAKPYLDQNITPMAHTHKFMYVKHQILGKRRTSVLSKCPTCGELSNTVLEGVWEEKDLM